MFWKRKPKTVMVMGVDDEAIMLNITKKACKPFGFKHKDRIVLPDGEEATIIGTGPSCNCAFCRLEGATAEKSLYFALDKFNGKVCYYDNDSDNLRDKGFRLKSEAEAEAETEPELNLTLEVTPKRGVSFKVDISDKKFGFKHGDRIVDSKGIKSTVMGVSLLVPKNKLSCKVLWISPDEIKNKVIYVSNEGLKKFGFKKLE